FFLYLNGATNATAGNDREVINILDVDPAPTLDITDTMVVEGNGGSTDMVFIVSLSGPPADQVTVRYATVDGTATGGLDYATNGGVLTFTTNTTATITIGVLGDVLDELDEHFTVVLSEAHNASLERGVATGTIIDDDPPTISIGDVALSEGNSNWTVFTFALTLSSSSTNPVAVGYYTSNGTAIAGSDYAATNGVVLFPPGAISAELQVLVKGDTLFESNEFFFVNLESPSHGTLATVRALGTIVNDDAPPPVTVENLVVVEGTCTNVQVTLAYSSTIPVMVSFCVTTLPTNVFLICDANCSVVVPTNVPGACKVQCCELTIPPGVVSASFQLCVERNGMDETNAVGAGHVDIVGGPGQHGTNQIVVVNVDPPTLFSSEARVVEGNSGLTNLCYLLRLSRERDTNVSVDFVTVPGTAREGIDYLGRTGTVVFPPGVTTQLVCVPVVGDLLFEGDETVYLLLTNAVNMALPVVLFRGLIVDDDPPPPLSISDATVIEGDTGFTMAVFTVTVGSPTDLGIDVEYTVNDITAVGGTDYLRDVGSLHFEPGVTNLTILVPVLGDTLDEPNETFLVRLRDPLNATFARRDGIGTIIDDDAPEIRVSNPDVVEGDTRETNFLRFAVTLSSTSAVPISVDFHTADGTAADGLDYLGTTGAVTFQPGQTSAVVVVAVIGETLPELNETLFLSLTNAVGGTIPGPDGRGTILDDDAPCLSVASATVQEPFSGGAEALFVVTLDRASTLDIAVSYSTSNGTAIAGSDYIAKSGTIIFSNGVTVQTVTIIVNSDLMLEPDETFYLHIFNPIHAVVCGPPGVATIVDGTVPPIATVGSVAVVEGNSGYTNAIFPVTLNRPSEQTVSFSFGTVDGTATGGVDYLARAGAVVFPPGTVSNFFIVPVVGDCNLELDETFLVQLSDPILVGLASNQAVGTILNDDGPPIVTVEGVTVQEGDTGTTNAVFRLHLSCASGLPISLHYSTADGTATAGADYIPADGTLTFPAGTMEASVTVEVKGDVEVEADETFQLVLSNADGATIGVGQATGLIVDDDGILIGIQPAWGVEGGTAVFTLTLSKPAGREVTVVFTTADDTATANLDYVPTNVIVRFPAGTTNQTQAVVLLSDNIEEPDEYFFAILSNPVHVALGTDRALGTIIDGTLPCFSIFDTSVQDDGSGNQTVTFSVTLNSPSLVTVCVHFATTNGTAIAGPDFIAAEGELCFPPGTTNGHIVIQILPNTRDETNEFFYVIFSNSTNATLCKGIAAATIINPFVTNMAPTVVLAAVAPCLTLPSNLLLSAAATDPDGRISSVEFFDHTNLLGVDLEAPFEWNWLDVPVGDHLLTAVAVDNIGARGTSAPVAFSARFPASLSINDSTVVEGNAGITNAIFTLTLSSASCQTVTVEVVTFDGSAIQGSDYLGVRTVITFAPGQTERTVAVAVLGDTEIEPDETFVVCLTNASHAVLSRACGLGTILNDDTNRAPTVVLSAIAPCLTLPANLVVRANAADPDGLVTMVQFFDHGILLGVRSKPPFEFNWLNVPPGSHLVSAIAMDREGARSTSAPVAFVASFPADLSIDDRTVVEGNSGFTDAIFTITLSSPSCHTVTVDVATFNGTATAGVDYLAAQTNFVFLPGEVQKTLTIRVVGDTEEEPDETFFVCLTNVSHAVVTRPRGLGTIINDDTNAAPHVSLAAIAPCLMLPTNLTLSAVATDPDGVVSRVEFFDYTNLIGMCLVSPFEFLWQGVRAGAHSVTAVAIDNYGARATSAPVVFVASFPANLSINDQTVVEGNSGMTPMVFTVTLSAATCHAVTVDVATYDGTATAGSDYLAGQTNLVFLPGETQKTIAINILGDTEEEPDETLFICLMNVSNAVVVRPCGLGTIINDDTNAPPDISLAAVAPCLMLPTNLTISAVATDRDGTISRVEFFDYTNMIGMCLARPFELNWQDVAAGQHLLRAIAVDNHGARATSAPIAFFASYPAFLTIDDQTVVEGNSGFTDMRFTLTLSEASCHTVMVDVGTLDGTASAGSDYVAAQTQFTFLPGETQKTLVVSVMGDTEIEPDETFFVGLTNVIHAILSKPRGVGTILNDDTNVPPSISLASVAPCVTIPANLSLSATALDSDGTISRVEFFDQGGMIGLCLTNPFTFTWTDVSAGEHRLTAVAVDNRGARATSAPVVFFASFPAALSINDSTVVEGNTGMTSAVFTVSLSSASCHTVAVEVVTVDQTALGGSDYIAGRTQLIFQPGETQQTFVVSVLGDTEIEPDETFGVCLTNISHAVVARGCGVGTILNDDTNHAPAVALAAIEPCVTLPTNLLLSATATDMDGLVTRVEFFDQAIFLGVRTIPPFEFIWRDVTPGDHLVSAVAMDSFGARATSAPVAFSASFLPVLSIDDQVIVEGNSGITNAVFTVSLSSASCHTVLVDVATSDGSAIAGMDYIAAQAHLVFLPGETQNSFPVGVIGDTRIEPDESFHVCLTNVAHASVARLCGLGTILNDDVNLPPTVTIVNPADGAIFYTPPGIVPIEAVAQDPDGYVTHVDFFADTSFVGVDGSVPFTAQWINLVPGSYVLRAIATDDLGARGTSAPVRITIRGCSTDLAATPMPDQARCVCDEVIFSTTVTSPEPVTFVWKLNGVVLPGENRNTLVLQGLKPSQAGLYTVEISTACASTSRSATLALHGAGNLNPVSFTNLTRIDILDHTVASPYPSSIPVTCLPGPVKHISVTLDGLSHSFPDDVDVLLVGPTGQALKLMSDAGGNTSQKLTNVILTFTDTATLDLPDSTRIFSGNYKPTDYGLVDPFIPPAPQTNPAASFAPFMGTNPNGDWSLYVVDDQGGDAGAILRGWYLTIEWADTVPLLTSPALLPDGRFAVTLLGLPHMTHVLEASSDLVNWTPIATNTLAGPSALLFDLRPGREPNRFYRAARCP
ncbi:MAG: large repetitive protein, partial [Verrucomicrobiota bacterium]